MKSFRQYLVENPLVGVIARVAAKVASKVDPGRAGALGSAATKSFSGSSKPKKKAPQYPKYPNGRVAPPQAGKGMHNHDKKKGNAS